MYEQFVPNLLNHLHIRYFSSVNIKMIWWVRFMLFNLNVGPNEVDAILENAETFLHTELKVYGQVACVACEKIYCHCVMILYCILHISVIKLCLQKGSLHYSTSPIKSLESAVAVHFCWTGSLVKYLKMRQGYGEVKYLFKISFIGNTDGRLFLNLSCSPPAALCSHSPSFFSSFISLSCFLPGPLANHPTRDYILHLHRNWFTSLDLLPIWDQLLCPKCHWHAQ